MSNEHAPTGGEGVTTDDDRPDSDEQLGSKGELDALFEVLADEQRRRILVYLDDLDDNVAGVSDLVEHVVDDSVGESPSRERIAVSLYHSHLPKLADLGIVEYDDRSETVRYRGGPEIADWIALVESHESDLSDS